MDDLRAEIGELEGLAIGQRRQRYRFGHQPRIGGQDAVHVGPYLQLAGIEQVGENRAGKIAAVAPQRGRAPVAIAGDETGDDDSRLGMGRAPLTQATRAFRPVHGHAQFAGVDHQYLPGIEKGGVAAAGEQGGVQQLRRIQFTQALDAFDGFAAGDAEHGKRVQQS